VLDPVSSKPLKNLDSGSAKNAVRNDGTLYLFLSLPGFYTSIWLLSIRLLGEFAES
jgi:hypothetical protein